MNKKQFDKIEQITYEDICNKRISVDILKMVVAIKKHKLYSTVGLIKLFNEDRLMMFVSVHFFATDEVCFDILKIEDGHLAVDYSIRATKVEKIITQRDMKKIGILDFRTKSFKNLKKDIVTADVV